MPKCGDCIHSEICASHLKAVRGIYGAVMSISGREANHLKSALSEISIIIGQICYDDCDRFQDRSRFVELPCHVGDTVYMLTEQTQKLGRKKITKTVIVECCVDNFRIGDAGYPSAALCDNENVWCYGVEPKMFGEIIFLSRESAEQSLKEREAT